MPPDKPEVTLRDYIDLRFTNLEREFVEIKIAIEKMAAAGISRKEFDEMCRRGEINEQQIVAIDRRLLTVESLSLKEILNNYNERIAANENVIKILRWICVSLGLIIVPLTIEALKNLLW
jgi:hypothetical protein